MRIALLVVLFTSGCAELPMSLVTDPLGLTSSAEAEMTEAELQSELALFTTRFGSVMGTLGEQITSGDTRPSVRRRALLLRIQLLPLVQQYALDRSPREGYVALLSLMTMLRLHATTEDGALDFGRHQARVEAATRQLENELVQLGRRFLDEEGLDRLRDEIEAFAREHQPSGGFAMAQVEASLVESRWNPRFEQILDIPMAPFRALSGVEHGPAAIREFTQTARGFAAIVATLPLQLRWQVELLLHETLQRDEVSSVIAALTQTAESAERLSAAGARLPEDLRRTLEASEGPLRQLDATLVHAEDLLEPLRIAAAEITEAGTAWEGVIRADQRQGEVGGRRDGPDFAAWQATASEIGEAARRLEAAARSIDELLQGLRRPGEREDATAGGNGALQRLDQQLRSLLDLVVGRIVLVLAIGFVLALTYRFLSARIGSSQTR